MKDENNKVHCLTKHNAAKRVAGEVSVVGFLQVVQKDRNCQMIQLQYW